MIDEKKSTLAHNNRRQDIQGLRAIAVLMVISFHAGLPIPGGFTGVDVFFVISGFVITTVVNRELTDTGSINWARFFARRFKRLAPGLSAMIASSMIISYFLSSPDGALKIASQTGTSATLFSANLFLALYLKANPSSLRLLYSTTRLGLCSRWIFLDQMPTAPRSEHLR